jgi:hypothetical protein
MCSTFDEYDVDVEIHGPAQLRQIVDKIKVAVRSQKLQADDDRSRREISDQSLFLDLDLSEALPDAIRYYFQCTDCERPFMLHCDPFHGSGGKWYRARSVTTAWNASGKIKCLKRNVDGAPLVRGVRLHAYPVSEAEPGMECATKSARGEGIDPWCCFGAKVQAERICVSGEAVGAIKLRSKKAV